VDRETKLIIEGDQPSVKDFSIESDYFGDITDSVLSADNTVLFIMYDLTKSNVDGLNKVSELISHLESQDVTIAVLSATTEQEMQSIKEDMNVSVPFYFTDETTLKTIVRSNPGMLWLKEGTIVDKWHFNDFPSADKLTQNYLN